MSSAMQVGRVKLTLDVVVEAVASSGNRLSVAAWCDGDDPAQVAATVENLRGYVDNPDEDAVPVVCAAPLAHLTGFYRVRGVKVDQGYVKRSDISLDLERVQGFAAPLFESVMLGTQRASSIPAQITGKPWHAIPEAAEGYETGILTPTVLTFASETGPVEHLRINDATYWPHYYNSRPQWYIPPASWYVGACSLKAGGNLTVGRQVANLPADWVVSNGIIRVRATAAGVGALFTERWNGSAWVDLGTWHPGRNTGAPGSYVLDKMPTPHTLTVMRNDPACVTIRLAHDMSSIIAGSRFVVHIDVSLRRGATVAEVTLSTRGNYTWGLVSPVNYSSLVQSYDAVGDATFVAAGVSEFGIFSQSGFARFAGMSGRQFDQWGFGYRAGQTQQWAAEQYAAAQAERVQAVAR